MTIHRRTEPDGRARRLIDALRQLLGKGEARTVVSPRQAPYGHSATVNCDHQIASLSVGFW